MNTLLAPNVRHAKVHFGDSIQDVALRELGDASRWVELVILNDLRPPFIDNEGGARTLRPGDAIQIPAPGSGVAAENDDQAVFKTDLVLDKRRLRVMGGDLELVGGVRNLTQALRHRVVVGKHGLAFHPEFGCWVRELLGAGGQEKSVRLAAFYVRSALLEDPRVKSVQSCVATLHGAVMQVKATVIPISGQMADLTMVV